MKFRKVYVHEPHLPRAAADCILHLYFASDNNIMINKTYRILKHIHNHWENTVDEKSHKKLRQILMEKYCAICQAVIVL